MKIWLFCLSLKDLVQDSGDDWSPVRVPYKRSHSFVGEEGDPLRFGSHTYLIPLKSDDSVVYDHLVNKVPTKKR